jgi:ATP-dependent DNA helicase RecG
MTLDELKKLLQSSENEHIEYKEASKQFDLKKLMKYCVAFAHEGGGKLVLGVNDQRQIVGTMAFPNIGNLKSKILDELNIRVNILELEDGDKRVLLLDIPARPSGTALHYKGAYFMRSGEDLVPMTPDQLQRIFAEGKPIFEYQFALENLTADEVISLLDVQAYFDLINIPLPKTQVAILDRFCREKLLIKKDAVFSITKLGAILFAKDLNNFESLARKAVRLIVYDGNSKIHTKRDITGIKGYAVAFTSLIQISDSKTDKDAVSRTIAATLENNLIRLNDPENTSKRYAKYVPFWS